MTDVQIIRWGRAVAGVAVVAAPLGWLLVVLQGESHLLMGVWARHNGLSGLGIGSLLWVMLPRQPRNRIIWPMAWSAIWGALFPMMLALGIFFSNGDLDGLPVGLLAPADQPLPAAIAFGLMSVAWPQMFVMLTIGLQRFPDGELLSPRWRWFERVTIATLLVASISQWILYRPTSTVPIDNYDTPFGQFVEVFIGLAMLWAVVSGAVLVLRYRRSTDEVRKQIRWIALGGMVLVLSFAGWMAFGQTVSGVGSSVNGWISLVAIGALIGAFWLAITKYRLYDVDLVISRAVTYGALALFIAGVYAVVVVGVGTLVNQTDEPNLWLSIGATAIIAVLFEPIHARIRRFANRLVYGERSTPYSVLSQLSSRLAASDGNPLTELAELAAAGTGAERVEVWSRVGDRLTRSAGWPSAPADASIDIDGLHRITSDLTVGVHDGNDVVGAIAIEKQRGELPTESDRRLLEEVAGGATLYLRNQRLNAELAERASQLRASRKRLVATQDAERHRLERDLHDGAQQQVVALKVKLGLAKAIADREGVTQIAGMMDGLAEDAQEVVDAMRVVARGIYPPLLESEGIPAALSAVKRTAAIPMSLDLVDVGRYSQPLEETVYFCVVGLVESAVDRGASTVAVALAERNGGLELAASHDGVYGDAVIDAVTDRVEAWGGFIDASDDDGRRVAIRLPVPVGELA